MKRATYSGAKFVKICFISIHALVKRATSFVIFWWYSLSISIHALVKRATL